VQACVLARAGERKVCLLCEVADREPSERNLLKQLNSDFHARQALQLLWRNMQRRTEFKRTGNHLEVSLAAEESAAPMFHSL
jgi:hypothetical protein